MLNFYTVKMKYVRNLMNIDHKNIMSVSSQYMKNKRIFVGIIIMVDEHQYCIPLSSIEEKSKYQNMSNNITFRKITNNSYNQFFSALIYVLYRSGIILR